ncbi:MAG: rhodanese-like domain-containing protein [Deltaproteobacteria bacterium]|nr:MAG: rhodanese-like domain-containing protein [Deltaproteobacteria bacterium]
MTFLIIASVILMLAIAAAFLIYLRRRRGAPREVAWPEIAAAARRGGYELILTTELAAAYLRDPAALLLVDTREPQEYQTGHIRGAVNFPLKPTRWARLRAQKTLAALLGPDRRRDVVFY